MTRSSIPALGWAFWAVAAAASVQLAPNPLYVTVVVVLSALVVEAHAPDNALARAFPVLLVAGIAFALLRLVLTAATTHGTGDVLFRLPEATVPRIFGGFTVGGTVELPVVAQAAAEGWALVGILAAFGAFNAVVSHYELVQSVPRAFFEIGLSVSVALAFVPSTITAIAAVREADRARTGGRVARRGRLLRQIVPIIETGMEKAVALSESMDSRGFGHRGPARGDTVAGALGLAGLLALGGGFVALVARSRATAAVLGAAGTMALLGAVAVASRGAQRTRYRPRRMATRDWALVAVIALAPAVLAVLTMRDDDTLVWPAASLDVPRVHVAALAALLALAAPVVARRRR